MKPVRVVHEVEVVKQTTLSASSHLSGPNSWNITSGHVQFPMNEMLLFSILKSND